MWFWVSDSRVAMSEERHEQKSAMDASVPSVRTANFSVPRANTRKFNVLSTSPWMLLICLCLVIFDAVFVVDADNCSCKSQDLAKGGEDCRVDDSHRRYKEGGSNEDDTEEDKQYGKKNLKSHRR